MKNIAIILSCEHAVNTIPKQYLSLFTPKLSLLETHEAIDLNAQDIARYFKKQLSCELFEAKASRLLIDCNRSVSHPSCFSKLSQTFTAAEKLAIMRRYYLPFRRQVIEAIQNKIDCGTPVLHLSIHSFTPILDGKVRQTDIGLLYDPKRCNEASLAKLWQAKLKSQAPNLRLRRNYPYRGISDGFTSALRKIFSNQYYLGLEVESNQALIQDKPSRSFIQESLVRSLLQSLACHN